MNSNITLYVQYYTLYYWHERQPVMITRTWELGLNARDSRCQDQWQKALKLTMITKIICTITPNSTYDLSHKYSTASGVKAHDYHH